MVTMKKSVTMEAVKSLLLEWDGDGSGLEAVETAGGTLYKVADVIVQNEDIPGMTVTDSEGKETLVTDSVYNDMISRSLVGDGFAAKVAGYVYLAQKAAQAPGAELPAGGIWLLKKQDGSYPKKVVLPAYREAFLQGEKPDGEKGESMGGGVTSWNDLTDRPFGEETVTDYLIPETAWENAEGVAYMGANIGLVEGQTYIINWNGTEYQCVATEYYENGGGVRDVYVLGNGGVIGLPNAPTTDEPFVMMDSYQDGSANFMAASFDGTSGTFSIKGEITTVTTIDPKYLPEGVASNVIPTFDLTEMGLGVLSTDGGSVVAEMDASALFAALRSGFVRIKWNYGEEINTIVSSVNGEFECYFAFFHSSYQCIRVKVSENQIFAWLETYARAT